MFVVPGSSVVVKVRAWKKQMFIDSLAETSIYWYIYIYVYIYIKITNCVWWEYCWPCFLDSTKWCDSDCEENTYHKKLACKVFSCHYQCHKLRKIFTGLTYKLLLRFKVISGVYRSFIPNKTMLTKYCLTPGELWNPLSKAVFGKFNWSGGHELNAINLWDFYVTSCNPVINILILLITPCLLMRIREFIHMQHHNTMLGLCIPCSKRCLSHSKMFPQL